MGLTDTAIKRSRPAEKPYKLADGKGLYLLVNPSGSKLWRWKYRHEGREKLMPFGVYPDVSLADARLRHAEARRVLAAGSDPMAERRAGKETAMEAGANPFSEIAVLWFDHWKVRNAPKGVLPCPDAVPRTTNPIAGYCRQRLLLEHGGAAPDNDPTP
jgi:hypothetical protein